jgi:hypothetical protein
MAEQKEHLLSESDLEALKGKVVKHIRSLNKAGVTTDTPEKLKTETLKSVLGIKETHGVIEQWLCGADGNCGAKVGEVREK